MPGWLVIRSGLRSTHRGGTMVEYMSRMAEITDTAVQNGACGDMAD
jgi:hypothetical protein